MTFNKNRYLGQFIAFPLIVLLAVLFLHLEFLLHPMIAPM